jgi:hypothetical protein
MLFFLCYVSIELTYRRKRLLAKTFDSSVAAGRVRSILADPHSNYADCIDVQEGTPDRMGYCCSLYPSEDPCPSYILQCQSVLSPDFQQVDVSADDLLDLCFSYCDQKSFGPDWCADFVDDPGNDEDPGYVACVGGSRDFILQVTCCGYFPDTPSCSGMPGICEALKTGGEHEVPDVGIPIYLRACGGYCDARTVEPYWCALDMPFAQCIGESDEPTKIGECCGLLPDTAVCETYASQCVMLANGLDIGRPPEVVAWVQALCDEYCSAAGDSPGWCEAAPSGDGESEVSAPATATPAQSQGERPQTALFTAPPRPVYWTKRAIRLSFGLLFVSASQ